MEPWNSAARFWLTRRLRSAQKRSCATGSTDVPSSVIVDRVSSVRLGFEGNVGNVSHSRRCATSADANTALISRLRPDRTDSAAAAFGTVGEAVVPTCLADVGARSESDVQFSPADSDDIRLRSRIIHAEKTSVVVGSRFAGGRVKGLSLGRHLLKNGILAVECSA